MTLFSFADEKGTRSDSGSDDDSDDDENTEQVINSNIILNDRVGFEKNLTRQLPIIKWNITMNQKFSINHYKKKLIV